MVKTALLITCVALLRSAGILSEEYIFLRYASTALSRLSAVRCSTDEDNDNDER